MTLVVALLGLLQQDPSPIAKASIRPAEVAIQVGDTVRLAVVAEDSAGRPVPGAVVRWFQSGGRFEGRVDTNGLVTGGATGAFTVSARVASAEGAKPVTAFARVTVLPPPASTVAVEPAVSKLYVGQSLVVTATPYAATGDRRYDRVTWTSNAPNVVAVSASGRLTARRSGRATITARAGRAAQSFAVTVLANPVTTVALSPATAEARTGDLVRLAFRAAGAADAVPEWSVSPAGASVDADGGFVAELPGTYRAVASFAGKAAEAVIDVRSRDVVRPTTVVGRLPLAVAAQEFWLHPNGRHGYVVTESDRMYAIDFGDPAKPAITDSLVVDARDINDVMTTEDGKYGVLTREGASTRKNGIVIFSLDDPAHPKPIAEYTETVTGGVHNVYVYRGYIYLTDNATGSMRVIDIRDPYKPREVARWEIARPPAGRMLHDIDVKDGLAYLSYWNDGLVVLDVGNGVKGGSPERPTLVTQYKYDLNALYRDVEAVGGPGFVRGTHAAWRQGKYVFVGDEVFPAKPLGRAYGRLHVIDVSDLERPREVAYYEPREGGAHNFWVAGDTLYLGDYQGGLRVLDISGELRGDLLRQGREIAHVPTGDAKGMVPNAPNAWGAVYRDGLIYVPDKNSGVWVVRVASKSELIP